MEHWQRDLRQKQELGICNKRTIMTKARELDKELRTLQFRIIKNRLKSIYILGKWLKFRCQHSNSLYKQMSTQPKSLLVDLKIKMMMMTVSLYLKLAAALINLLSLIIHLSFKMINPAKTLVILNREVTSAIKTKSNQSSKRCLLGAL